MQKSVKTINVRQSASADHLPDVRKMIGYLRTPAYMKQQMIVE